MPAFQFMFDERSARVSSQKPKFCDRMLSIFDARIQTNYASNPMMQFFFCRGYYGPVSQQLLAGFFGRFEGSTFFSLWTCISPLFKSLLKFSFLS